MILSPAELINYHEQQITSRSLSRKLGIDAPMTLYALDQAETISNETSTLVKLIQILEGRLEVTIEPGDKSELTVGELMMIPAGQLHNLKAKTPCKILQLELPARKGE